MSKSDDVFYHQAAQRALEPMRTAGTPAPPVISLKKTAKPWVASHRVEVEGVHFDPTFITPFDLGCRLARANLFEMATSGKMLPKLVQVSVGIHGATSEGFLEELFRGMGKTAREFSVQWQFGRSTPSPTSFFVSQSGFGEALKPLPKPKAGDLLAVTGTVGIANAGLQCLKRFGWPAVKDHAKVVRAHLCPQPPLEACLDLVSAGKVTSSSALVDGLSADLHRLSEENQVGIYFEEALLPVAPETREAASLLSMSVRRWALFGCEDLGWMTTVPKKNWNTVETRCKKWGVSLTPIGELRRASDGVRMKNLESEQVALTNKSWNPLVRSKAS